MTSPVSPDDLAARWRPLTETEVQSAWAWLDDAWAEVLAVVPRVEERLASGVLDEQIVKRVVCAMVLRVLKNPEGKRTEAIDDYSYTRDNALSAGNLYLDPAEAALLMAPRAASSGVGSIRLAPGPWACW